MVVQQKYGSSKRPREQGSSLATRSRLINLHLQALLLTTALILPSISLAANIGDKIPGPGGIELTVTEKVEYGVIAEASNGTEYRVLDIPAVGSNLTVQTSDGDVSKKVVGYSAGGKIVATYKLDANGQPVSDAGDPITGIAFGIPADGDTPAQVTESIDVVILVPGSGTDVSNNDLPGQAGITKIERAANGKNGRAGALFVPAKSGGDGKNGTDINYSGGAINGAITGAGAPGIIIASIGGNGGKGGNSYLGTGGKAGGDAGTGGNVNATLGGTGTVTTTGDGSIGIVVQSRAGVGGDGGSGYATGGGGSGGQSSNGGTVSLNNALQVTTHGNGSHGVLVQSLGGGAGNGGGSYGLFGDAGGSRAGGDGGTVSLTNSDSITTKGDAAYGILAQSIGGQGGDGGSAVGLVSFSGTGGVGGNGGNVSVNATAGTISTEGRSSYGILAQSVGGSGGNAGWSSGLVALGADAGRGGNSGNVSITTGQQNAIVTTGTNSHAIFGQSVGGGGGNAGFSGGLVALGASGGLGGSSGTIDITHGGSALTGGAGAYGIFAQSVGGGGGSGATAGGLIALGGSGSAGGDANNVSVNILKGATVETTGTAARGIVAQSVGGGGGDASTSGGLVSLGGKGSKGGKAGDVNVGNAGTVKTKGNGSDAIFAQSVGGGGGSGAGSGGFVSIGGSGAGGGNGGSVIVENTGGVSTSGEMARGIFAQSVGGGGGAAGSGGGVFSQGGTGGSGGNAAIGGSSTTKSDGGAVRVENSGFITTVGSLSSAIQAQSIGGGGGDGGNAGGVFMAIGGQGGAGGAGGNVEIVNKGTLSTKGADSNGIFAQSIGGGGGNGGWTVGAGVIASVSIGGKGGNGGTGGQVDLTFADDKSTAGSISTDGDRSRGVFAQSVGGGGGAGGWSVATSVGAMASASVALGGTGGDGGAGGVVNANGYTNVFTQGAFSEGMLLQSVGGGGGAGGFSIAGTATVGIGAAVGVSIGGAGGKGGAGGDVTLRDGGGFIQTTGNFSNGLVAQSIGGGGGSGGFAVAGSAYAGAGLAVTTGIGGTGGGGGAGGKVIVDFDGNIQTFGAASNAALIQSVGGGGGAGGFNIAASASGGIGAGAISVGIGASGGEGGHGGIVNGTIDGKVSSKGDQSSGVIVQSIGGGGGAGGYTVAGAVSGGLGAGSPSVGIGGSGGKGGNGGAATGKVTGTITTEGNQSNAFLVQSVGGGGGSGGFSVAGSIAGGLGAGAISVGIGGSGGEGGTGGNATGVAEGIIHTSGNQSSGMIVQSIGGGGGSGGFNVSGSIGGGLGAGAISVGLGGFGSAGGDAGNVNARSVSITTKGTDSTGFLAQSVGGGGGSGGFNVSGSIAGAAYGAGAVSIGLGGSGAGGGNGGIVDAVVNGNVTTLGTRSSAIIAQSIGGGGGSGGFNVAAGIAGAGTGAGTINVGLGGAAGAGGDGKKVSLTVTGTTGTAGTDSIAILAQSVGGGGGAGALNVTGGIAGAGTGAGTVGVSLGGQGGDGGDAGQVVLNVVGATADNDLKLAVLTEKSGSAGVIAQSIGGGGGSGGFSVVGSISAAGTGSGNVGVGLGGGGGKGGKASTVEANIDGAVITRGADAGAILAQSAGGGGGSGGFNVAGGIAASGKGSGNLMVGIGGFGGGGGDGAAVSGTVNGDIFTQGDRSFGLTYQSLGGGGGSGGFNVTGGIAISKNAGTAGVGIGGFGGDGGHAGKVNLTYNGDITTQGNQAYAALIQSVGGGGGAGGFNITGGITGSQSGSGNIGIGIGGFGGGGGDADAVVANLTGHVETLGAGSFGALMQSVGGAGGAGGMNITGGANLTTGNSPSGAVSLGLGGFGGGGGDAGSVTATVTGGYLTKGADAFGVSAQSVGGGGGSGGINISGAVAVGTGNSAAVTVGVGGFGGDGGNAGNVSLTRTGDTQTEGTNADAVIAQSVGGGGGSGGVNISGSLSATTNASATSISLGLGGFGGGGGDAGAVTAKVTGNVWAKGADDDILTIEDLEDGEKVTTRTRSNGSNGVVAQSIGGGGGTGGLNVSGSLAIGKPQGANTRAVTLGVGGFGGAGGNASTVALTIGSSDANRVQIQANGDNRSAAIAQSIGGGGGAGGINVSGTLTLDANATFGVGGFGGEGGRGDAVTANVDADLYAAGAYSRGLMVQSIGGGGGAGAINISGGVQADKYTSEPSLVFGIGGFGGAGNISGNVDATQNGQIIVEGNNAIGALVQSVAGGGGSGGLNVAGNVSLGDKKSVAVALGVGGSGGEGADAGAVSFTSTGDIIVNGQIIADAKPDEDNLKATEFTGGGAGVLVQSIGGGGGVGGANVTGVVSREGSPVSVGVGGSGSSGGNAGAVTVTRGYSGAGVAETAAPGLIRTFGDATNGLVAQSIGGGGGQAGANLVLGVKPSGGGANGQDFAAIIAVGGSGAGAGSGDTVNVRHNGTIVTDGTASSGLIAQSIGGGGGDAFYNIGAGVLKDARFAMNIAIGGDTGAAGSGGAVTVDHVGNILTKGDLSYGMMAQSIGGGGGNAGTSMAVGILANSSVSIGLGRKGGEGGESGDVKVTADGHIQTLGEGSTAILAQSIGGGGGTSSAHSISGSTKDASGESSGASLAVGIEGGVGAVSGKVDVSFKGVLTTEGSEARGIIAQSIGGGGGIGGTAGSTLFMAANSANIAVGGSGGKGAVSDKVLVVNDGIISTKGEAADGILAQSIGGGGGLGGSARTLAFQVKGGTTMRTATVSVGGTGGEGARAESVTVTNRGIITTEGREAFGIRAQSIGGGGGIGGSVISATIQGPFENQAVELNIGGAGGTGAAGGAVTVDNTGLIYTTGKDAAGISANSIGGGGGDAGVMLNLVVGTSGANKSQRAVVNLGGTGGTGGIGGTVAVSNKPSTGEETGWIVTKGDGAYGILAQSIGGGGGNGSSIVSIQGMVAGTGSTLAGLNVGGKGGSGETGGLVTVDNAGLIDTSGAGAHGVLAQSVGGGGGNGGLVLSMNALIAPESNAPLISVGGNGGDGGDGGKVIVNNSGDIVTRGANANGVVAQSIGGGGGNANMALAATNDAASIAISGVVHGVLGAVGGGAGGQGGEVVVNHSGDITVLGQGSTAIKAESINGGGGTLALDFDGVIGLPGAPVIGNSGNQEVPDTLVIARAGSQNASGMNAGKVTVTSTGSFGAGGALAVGDLAQAIGGGGGQINVRARIVADNSATNTVPVNFELALGGEKGSGNNGGDITTSQTGAITTTGLLSAGILSQSIGGGGGFAVGNFIVDAGAVMGDIHVSLGAISGLDETGSAVSRTQTGRVITTGQLATGALLQSIGGGGGAAIVQTSGAGEVGKSLLSLGADGGSGANGGAVTGNFTGGVVTTGAGSVGLIMQSVGAGGGDIRIANTNQSDIRIANTNQSDILIAGADKGKVFLGGTNGATGDGGTVSLANNGIIVTDGNRAHGMLLQSIGGGGGSVFGADSATQLTLNRDNSGNGGAISLHQLDEVAVLGNGAYGIIAQSLGGGGGWVDGVFAGSAGGQGAGGTIDLTVADQIYAAGTDSVGIFAQSAGRDGAGNITMNLAKMVRGGSGLGAAIVIDGGADNHLIASGSLSAVSGWAVRGTSGHDKVENRGLTIGNVDLGSGDNRFLNNAGATFVAFDTISLRNDAVTVNDFAARVSGPMSGVVPASSGSVATFTNDGTFLMGLEGPRWSPDLAAGYVYENLDGEGDAKTNLLYGSRVINTVALDGNFVQTATGHMVFDVAYGPYASDRVNVTGDAVVAGTGRINLMWLENARPLTLFATDGQGVDNGLTIPGTLALDYGIIGDADGIHLTVKSDFGLSFLRPNEQRLGAHMDSALQVGDASGIGRLMAALGNMETGQEGLYKHVFNELNPEGHIAPLHTQYLGAASFNDQLFECRWSGGKGDQCIWAKAGETKIDQEADQDYWGATSRVFNLRAGFEQRLEQGWSFTGAFGYNRLDSQFVDGGRFSSQGNGFDLGLGARREFDNGFDVRLKATGGWQWFDTVRSVNVFEPGTGEAEGDSGYGQLSAEIGYATEANGLSLRPALAFTGTALRTGSYEETGLGGLGVRIDARTQYIGAVEPKVSFGYAFTAGDGTQAAFAATAGWVYRSTDRLEAPISFVGASRLAEAAMISTPLDRSSWKLGASAGILTTNGWNIEAGYEGQFGERTEVHTGSVNLRWKF